MLEERGASEEGPAGAVTPGGGRAGGAESVLQAALGGVRTGGTVMSVEAGGKKKRRVFNGGYASANHESVLLIIVGFTEELRLKELLSQSCV